MLNEDRGPNLDNSELKFTCAVESIDGGGRGDSSVFNSINHDLSP